MTRILLIGHSYVLAVNRAVARELAAGHGLDVTVAAPDFYQGDLRPAPLEPEPEGSPLRVAGLPARLSRWPHAFHYSGAALKQLLAEEQFDVISAWEEPYIFSGWQLARAARANGKARFCFYSCQNLSKQYPPPFSWFERQTLRWADGWQASGELVFQTLTARGYDPDRGEVLALAVDTSLFRPLADEERRATLAALGLEGPVIGFVGRLTPEKGLAVLRRALEGLPETLCWSALFLGSGPEGEVISRWAAERGWQGRVRVLLARHDEVPRYLGAMDLLAAPSQTTPRWREQFGRMLIEAFACGVPALGSDSGEIPHVIGDAGVVLPEADPAAWTREIARLLTDADSRAALTQRGLARAQAFSARTLASRHAAFYRKLLERPRRP